MNNSSYMNTIKIQFKKTVKHVGITWKKHETKYTDARNLYKIHSSQKDNINDCVTVSADLQKVIMLPRAEMFKKVIFTRRIIA